ncbi:thioredoxin domain-containing protein [Leucobacter sp. CSA1]|uniref:Thioredoxin domain-containing protein n=2 Tax=Leucobacter chromiisoli TaxID=2796471 RepID=A0A934Q7Q4_9MICO|nr:thioredoxin domain-containing protein [Leucobacter chromiisoli]
MDRTTLERRYRLLRNYCVVLGALVIVLAVVIGMQMTALDAARSGGGADAGSSAGEGRATAEGRDGAAEACPVEARREADDPMALGDADAPVVLAEWTDFRCPYCGVFSRDTLPVLIEEYVDTGKVRIEVHDADFIEGEVSARVAVAARAAGEQGRYFEYLFAVYDDMTDDRPEITDERLLEYARQAAVPDLPRFSEDLGSEELREAVRASSDEARRLGVSSVPFFADTGTCGALQGAQPVGEFRSFLDGAVEQAEQREGEQ